jgi:hypothetical protein
MRRLLILATLLAPAFAAPAMAQDADPANQITEGVLACLSGGGDIGLTGEMLDAMFWSDDGEGEEGLFYFTPGAGEDTFIYMAGDGSFCHVESMVLDSATTSEILAATLESQEGTSFFYSQDEAGCTRLDLESGVTVTITSGGNDPTCASETDAGLRFAF